MLNSALAQRDPAARSRLLLTVLALALLWPGLSLSELDIGVLFDGSNADTMGIFLSAFWPPEHGRDFLALLWTATLETLAIATAGMALALAVALPCALIATRALSVSALSRGGRPHRWAQALRWPVRGLLIVLRSVPEIGGAADPRPTRARLGAGSSRRRAFAYAVLAHASGEMLSYTVYRWECAFRASVVRGFVGAGGLGQQMDLSMRMFAGGEVASML